MSNGDVPFTKLSTMSKSRQEWAMIAGPLATRHSLGSQKGVMVKLLTDTFLLSVLKTKLNESETKRLGLMRYQNLKACLISWFFMVCDKRGIKILKGFDYDEKSRDWAH